MGKKFFAQKIAEDKRPIEKHGDTGTAKNGRQETKNGSKWAKNFACRR
ncbi:hypothetical protein AB434_2086 [Heyndrickxia coagulans]|uniref:Uncharacterized protein n=1 Tax=Heyndrickxia coagulans TaxID=1398 RepID=A0AAN0T719_HEYCO|nr:hypothetical protein SB48_HM08orf05180 [Heyndrickxia coagulans]AKN54491.1 hypothetical protein AB434_2086 [Heyndrickxia coagulans]